MILCYKGERANGRDIRTYEEEEDYDIYLCNCGLHQ
jgi:hypothetical protein